MFSLFRTLMLLSAFCIASTVVSTPVARADEPVEVLFLGDNGHHQPPLRFRELNAAFAERGIRLTYTDDMSQVNPETLGNYQAVVLYANIDEIAPAQADALLAYVEQGGGFVPLHCASFCFRNDPRIVALMGAQFQRHGTGVFRTKIVEPDHPVMAGFRGFESWDETYVHTLHNEAGRTVLEVREDEEGAEPWTWVKTAGEGRVFYTAWGHDQRTWLNPGFQNLVERGIRWAAKLDPSIAGDYTADEPFPVPAMTEMPADLKPFEYIDVGAKIPNYTPGGQWGAQGENLSLMQLPLAPEESLKHYVVPRGFHLELFASEPDIGGKPIAIAWDERGRLWVAETVDYPNELQPIGRGRDRIRICEDTDHDGVADRFTVFAEGLSIPTTLIFAQGSVIVQDASRTLRLTDTDGDDVADKQEIVFGGWAVGDTHGGVSNFQYGLDNWIWGMQGYNSSRPTIDGEPTQGFRQGFFRFRADGSDIEFVRSTDNNTWGFGLSEEGIVFGSTANHNPSVYMPIPNRYYESVRGWAPSALGTIADTYLFKPITDRVRQVDQFGGYTAGAGHALYTARTYPQEYWNRTAFVNGPTGHLTGTFVLRRDGADFHSTSPFNLIASDDEWAAPIMAEVGPDGQVWVIDWYNYIIQHNPTPRGFETGRGNAYETDLRDKKHARIYRVVFDAGEPSPWPDLSTNEGCLQALSNPNLLWRRHAQRLLVERGDLGVVPALVARLREAQLDPIGLDVGAIHALWVLEGLNVVSPENLEVWRAVAMTLSHPSAGVRRNACQVIAGYEPSVAELLTSGVLEDDDAQVRLAALLALADSPASNDAGQAIAACLASPLNSQDAWLPDAAVAAAARHDVGFLSSLVTLDEPNPALIRAIAIVAEHHARAGDYTHTDQVLAALPGMPADVATQVIQGLSKGWPNDARLELSAETEERLLKGLEAMDPAARGPLIKLTLKMGSDRFEEFAQEVASGLLEAVADYDLPLEVRLDRVKQLVDFRGDDEEVIAELSEQMNPQAEPELIDAILVALRSASAPNVGAAIREHLGVMTPPARKEAVATMMLRAEWTSELLAAIENREVLLSELSLEQQRGLAAHPDNEIAKRAEVILMSGGTLPSEDRKEVIEAYLPSAELEGDVAKGEVLFRNVCSNCHTYKDIGNRVGPDLTGMALHPKEELLVHILDPNASVEGNFRVYTVSTIDGLVLSGLLASETRTAIQLFDSQGKPQTILREDIDELVASSLSLMPVGFEKQLDVEQMADLLAFLTQRGKYLPLDISKVATIASDRGMFYNPDADAERLIFDKWGLVPFNEIPFVVNDPRGGEVANAILLHGPIGTISRTMPREVSVPCAGEVARIHLLSGVSGWGFPYGGDKTVSLIVRLHYADGEVEDHELRNGVHFADYIRRVDVPESEFAFALRGQQIRYLAIEPRRNVALEKIDFVKGPDESAPVVMAVTVEAP
ncbi:MAG: ThuA domain-containing protein [Planctomycetales bacterium]|nr:ThuA domain-containing protein [Planctomycetales bacterium]